jgi:hypothetical protein
MWGTAVKERPSLDQLTSQTWKAISDEINQNDLRDGNVISDDIRTSNTIPEVEKDIDSQDFKNEILQNKNFFELQKYLTDSADLINKDDLPYIVYTIESLSSANLWNLTRMWWEKIVWNTDEVFDPYFDLMQMLMQHLDGEVYERTFGEWMEFLGTQDIESLWDTTKQELRNIIQSRLRTHWYASSQYNELLRMWEKKYLEWKL